MRETQILFRISLTCSLSFYFNLFKNLAMKCFSYDFYVCYTSRAAINICETRKSYWCGACMSKCVASKEKAQDMKLESGHVRGSGRNWRSGRWVDWNKLHVCMTFPKNKLKKNSNIFMAERRKPSLYKHLVTLQWWRGETWNLRTPTQSALVTKETI